MYIKLNKSEWGENENDRKAKGEEEKQITNHPESSKRYPLINLKSFWDFSCIEKAYKVKYKCPPGQSNAVLSWLYSRPQNAHRSNYQ